MTEKLIEKALDFVVEKVPDLINNYKTDANWTRLFSETGEFLVDSPETLGDFKEDLLIVFTKDNLKSIAKRIQNKRGYEFPNLLHNELYNLMQKYEIPEMEAATYTHHFCQIVFKYLEDNDSDKYMELYLGKWRTEENKRFEEILENQKKILDVVNKLNEGEKNIFTISDIEKEVRRKSKYSRLNLEFFEIDDEQFEIKFKEEIKNDKVFIVGKSKEETLYRVLNELKNKYPEKPTFIVKSVSEWEKVCTKELCGYILIPFFYADTVEIVPNNTNIFIFGEEEPCRANNKLVMRKRTRQNLVNALESIGVEYQKAYKMINDTHGLYIPMKKHIFNEVDRSEREWIKNHSNAVMTALLCGKWTDSEGDILVFEEISGVKYAEAKKELSRYFYGEAPLLVDLSGRKGENIQLASIEDAWEELDIFITDEIWDKFISAFKLTLIESEPIFKYPINEHFKAQILEGKPEWSKSLKEGMIRTLIMRAYYKGHIENQSQVDAVVREILDTITSKDKWAYISQYIMLLCEASPKAVLEKLENEFKHPSGLKELFEANSGDFMTPNYYTNIIWAVEQLLHQKEYAVRAVEWLWKMDSYDIKYDMGNNPKQTLSVVFCAWFNGSILSVEDKLKLAEKAMGKYKNAWDLIFLRLPSGRGETCSPVYTPTYRIVEEPDVLYMTDVNKTYNGYLDLCIENAKCDFQKWKRLINNSYLFGVNRIEEIFKHATEIICKWNDEEKSEIKESLRNEIYRHRYFANSEWSMSEEEIVLYEKLFNSISFDEESYEYIYLFSGKYDFPLLNPVPYEREEVDRASRKNNEVLRQEEIAEKIREFKKLNLSVEKLIELVLQKDNSLLGYVLAEYYCHDKLDVNVLEILVEKDKKGFQLCDYISYLYRINGNILNEIYERISNITNNEDILTKVISVQKIKSSGTAFIAKAEEKIKNIYWKRLHRIPLEDDVNTETILWCIEECGKYGSIDSYLDLLYYVKDRITKEQLLTSLYYILKMNHNVEGQMTDYYLEELLKILHNEYFEDEDRRDKIAEIELLCRELLDWEDMKCLQHSMKTSPRLYAELVNIVYKKDNQNTEDEEKNNLASKMYGFFEKAKFCPAEKDKVVDYAALKKWIEDFKQLLSENNQLNLFGYLTGRLLAFSPADEDGYSPCVSVRKIVEEYFDDSLKNSYVVAERNKRGGFSFSAGKSELSIAKKYKENAEAIQTLYPHTAEIYFSLSKSYEADADYARKEAEDEF